MRPVAAVAAAKAAVFASIAPRADSQSGRASHARTAWMSFLAGAGLPVTVVAMAVDLLSDRVA
jgi:hypothetical protein